MVKARAVYESWRFHYPSISALYFILMLFLAPGSLESTGDTGHRIIMAQKTSQKSRKTRKANGALRPRKKARMDEEGATGERTSVAERLVEREGKVFERSGAPAFLVDGEWRRVPNELWAWSPYRIAYRYCRECSFPDDCQHELWMSDVRHLTRTT